MLEEYYLGDLHPDDKTGSTDRGAKSWGASPAAVEEERSGRNLKSFQTFFFTGGWLQMARFKTILLFSPLLGGYGGIFFLFFCGFRPKKIRIYFHPWGW